MLADCSGVWKPLMVFGYDLSVLKLGVVDWFSEVALCEVLMLV